MIKSQLPVCIVVVLLLTSCQKEIDWGASGNAGTVLYRVKSTSGTDSSQVDYTYDGAGRLIREKTTAVSAGLSMDNDLVINRGAGGVITTTVQKSPAYVAIGVDSVLTRYYYDVASGHYIAASFTLSLSGFEMTDSARFTYDANGRITKDEHYMSTVALGIPVPPALILRNTYTYDAAGKNLLSISQDASSTPGDPLVQAYVQAYTYDAKTNPLFLQQEAIVIARPDLYSASNVASLAVTDVADPANNYSTTLVYSYNNNNRPDACVSTDTPGGTVTNSKFYYR